MSKKSCTTIPFGLILRRNFWGKCGFILGLILLLSQFQSSNLAFGQIGPTIVATPVPTFPVRIAARLIDIGNGKPVPYASIQFKNTKKGLVADSNGFFTCVMVQSDTLKISSLGYYDLLYVKDPNRQTNYFIEIPMRSKIFELKAVEILAKRNPNRENPFLRWEYKAKFQPKVWLFYTPGSEPAEEPSFLSPITYLYNQYSRRGKAARKLRDMVADRARKKVLSVKYNAQKVSAWTGLVDEELEEFMQYCPMPEAFLESATEFEIISKTFRCLEDFDNREEDRIR